jgi:hypothetical protein
MVAVWMSKQPRVKVHCRELIILMYQSQDDHPFSKEMCIPWVWIQTSNHIALSSSQCIFRANIIKEVVSAQVVLGGGSCTLELELMLSFQCLIER